MRTLSRTAAIELANIHFSPVFRLSHGWVFEAWDDASKEWTRSIVMDATTCRTIRSNHVALKAFSLMFPGEPAPPPPTVKDAREKLNAMVINRNKENNK